MQSSRLECCSNLPHRLHFSFVHVSLCRVCSFVFPGRLCCLLSFCLCLFACRVFSCSALFCSSFIDFSWVLAISLDRQICKALFKSKFSSLSSRSFVALSCRLITMRSLISSSVNVPNLHDDAALLNRLTYSSIPSSVLCAQLIEEIPFVNHAGFWLKIYF